MYRMEMMQPTTPDTMLWLSQLGMQDPSLVEHFESLGSIKTEQLANPCEYPFCLSPSFASVESSKVQKDPLVGMVGNLSAVNPIMYLDRFLNHQKPAKILKPNGCEVRNDQPAAPSFWQKHAYALPREQHLFQQFAPEVIDSFGNFLPQLGDDHETYDLLAPQNPILHGDATGSPASVKQESVVSDVLSGGTLSSSNTANLVFTPTQFSGKRKSDQLLSDGTSVQATFSDIKPSGHTMDHIMAERKRREKLSQRFIALSAIIPGLKKMDKATVLGDAIKYVKQLQDKVKGLEDQTSKKVSRSVNHLKELSTCQDATSVKDTNILEDHEQLPEIDVRMVDESVLIKVHCEKKKGTVAKILAELEKLHLLVSNAQILSFSKTEHDLTFMAQVEDSYDLTVDSIMQALRALFRSFN
ncbi:hypothetical protein O6H91_15G077000 [Diphasiastrum complanatum]|uniref:Uncharacterized protein n=2 Tax=Diphasiastrum complanatum TaxID=34168 RepID=A0ACC2BK23_DIPCM|nr:hypothetical protein O6H91_15G077000 [Diphasiastrum complanatum]KAJ7530063.1 hypothetical protein O6H91_15G077000 [Diphasiastrum complanatum]